MIRNCLSVLSEIDLELSRSRRVLVASDFDGCLCPIADSPSAVRPAPGMVDLLRRIAACPGMTLAVISGRALEDVACRLPVDAVFAGNHGLEIAGCGLGFEHDAARETRPRIADACEALRSLAVEWRGAWIEDKGLTATLHYRRVDPRDERALLLAARRRLATFGPALALRIGKKALEVRPRIQWGKGSALEHIRACLGPFDACIAMGDDRTDETMFMDGQINIKIGRRLPTKATHCLADPGEVGIFLAHVFELFAARRPGAKALPRVETAASPIAV